MTTSDLLGFLPLLIFLLELFALFSAVYALFRWASRDAEARGKPGWAVAVLVLVFFPVGPAVWALVRPPKLPPAKLPFDLERFRVQ